jgi:hypothetical protein
MKAHLAAARASFVRADADHHRYLSLVSAHEISVLSMIGIIQKL